LAEMAAGLEKDGLALKMIPTFVTRLPQGHETVTIYALDIGGSNLRVIRDRLSGNGKIVQEKVVKKTIPDAIQKSDASQLFDFVADAIAEAMIGDDTKDKSLGFTFSFPVSQTALASGTLIKWTKGFTAAGVENNDVVALLDKALKRKGVDVTVAALANDTTGTMMAGAYQSPGSDCCIGLILGTGSNACYVEKIENVKKWKGDPTASGLMAINIEWGNFDSEKRQVLPLTEFDKMLDKQSPNYGSQIYEKLMSGMYLGEIVRLVIKQLQSRNLLLSGTASSQSLDRPYAFDTAFLSQIVADNTPDLQETLSLLRNIGVVNSTLAERQALKEIATAVGVRAAQLAAVGIAAVVTKMGKGATGCSVAVDGSVYEHFPGFRVNMQATMAKILGNDKVKMVLTKDGSGNGAAVIAAVH
jgi:hexokinase